MRCPDCQSPLAPIEAGPGLELDRCEACKGLWFDARELPMLDEVHELPESPVLEGGDENPGHRGTLPPEAAKRACPRCDGIKLRRHFFSWRKDVQVDTCASCGGTWLDHGELVRLRAEYRDAKAREADTVRHVTGQLAPFEALQDAALARTEARLAAQASRGGSARRLASASPVMAGVLERAVDGLLDGLLDLW